MRGARGPDLLSFDDVMIAVTRCGCFESECIGAACRFGHTKGLQAQFARGDLGQIPLLLLRAAMTQHRAHGVHLGVAHPGVAARVVHLLQDHRRLAQLQTAAAVLLRDAQSGQSGVAERGEDVLGVLAGRVDLSGPGLDLVLCEPTDRGLQLGDL